MNNANELLRSAHEIAKREGANTNWKAFENNLRRELLKLAGVPDSTDEQTILRATCTAKTYQTFPSFQERVIAEKAELDEKIVKLEKFLNSGKISSTSGSTMLLVKQSNAMRAYSNVLGKRIGQF